jgi:hypothetical protein
LESSRKGAKHFPRSQTETQTRPARILTKVQ